MVLYFLYLVFTLILVVAIWCWWYFTCAKFWKLCSKIPGPPGLPVIGNTLSIIGKTDKLLRFIIKNYNEYYPIFKFTLPGLCVIVLQDADDIYTVLRSDKTISKSFTYKAICQTLGKSLFTAQREQWRKDRKLMNPAFRAQVINTYIPVFNRKSRIFVNILKNEADGKRMININTYLGILSLDMISETSLGVNSQIQEQSKFYLLHVIEKSKAIIQKCIQNPLYCVDFIYRYSNILKENVSSRGIFLKHIREIIRKKEEHYQHQEKIEASEGETSAMLEKKSFGFLEHVFQSSRNTFSTNIVSELEDQILFLMVAGTDTTAFTLSVCFMLLAIHGDIQDKVLKEIQDIFGKDTNRPAEYEDLKQMIYTEQVLKETMRLFPAPFFCGRRVDEDVEVGGYTIPAGADIGFSPYFLHRNPKYFPDPLKFDPRRFSSEKSVERNPHCFIPFLSGPRMCIGHYYAMVQMKITLSHTLRNFELLPCCTREEMEEVDVIMLLSLKNGYNICLKPRHFN